MKKIVFVATAFVFGITVMAQTETKTQTKSATKVPQATKVIKTPTGVNTQVLQTPAQDQVTPDNVIKVNTLKHDFGKIKQSVPVTYAFEIKNISDKAVVVENTYASCGCTTPEKIVEPIAPGASTSLKVQYNAANIGAFTKDVHIKLAGITQEKIVQITGEVVAAEPPKEIKNN